MSEDKWLARVMPTAFRLPKWLGWLLGGVLLLELAIPFFTTTYGVDGPNQLYWIGAFNDLLFHGDFFPRWLPNGYRGMGAPSFYFYPPLAFYCTGLFRLLTGITRPETLFQGVGLIATVASGYTFWKLLARFQTDWCRLLLGSAIYAFSPFRFAELYYRSSISSQVGYVIVPLVLAAVIDLGRNRETNGARTISRFAIVLALLILSSIPLTIVVAIFVVIGLALWRKRVNGKFIGNLVLGSILAAGLTGFYLCSILAYKNEVHLGRLTNRIGYFIQDLIHFQSQPELYFIGLFFFGAVVLIATFWRPVDTTDSVENVFRRLTLWSFGIIAVLEVPFFSRPIWEHIPIISLIQGSWRLYLWITLIAGAAIAIVPSKRRDRAATWVMIVWAIGSIVPGILMLTNFHFYNHYVAQPIDPPEYVPQNVRNADLGLKDSSGAQVAFVARPVLQYGESILEAQANPKLEQYQTQLRESKRVTFHRFFWPTWQLFADRERIPNEPDSEGRATAELPSGTYVLQWRLERTPLETAGFAISGLSLLIAVALVAPGVIRTTHISESLNL